jgi:osmoprotectant transport system permease protein
VRIGRLLMPWSRPDAAQRRRSIERVERVDAA